MSQDFGSDHHHQRSSHGLGMLDHSRPTTSDDVCNQPNTTSDISSHSISETINFEETQTAAQFLNASKTATTSPSPSPAMGSSMPPLPPPLRRTLSEPTSANPRMIVAATTPPPPPQATRIAKRSPVSDESADSTKRLKRMEQSMKIMSEWGSHVMKSEYFCTENSNCASNSKDECEEVNEEAVWVETQSEGSVIHFKCSCCKGFIFSDGGEEKPLLRDLEEKILNTANGPTSDDNPPSDDDSSSDDNNPTSDDDDSSSSSDNNPSSSSDNNPSSSSDNNPSSDDEQNQEASIDFSDNETEEDTYDGVDDDGYNDEDGDNDEYDNMITHQIDDEVQIENEELYMLSKPLVFTYNRLTTEDCREIIDLKPLFNLEKTAFRFCQTDTVEKILALDRARSLFDIYVPSDNYRKFIAINIADRYMWESSLNKNQVEKIAISCVLLSSREEVEMEHIKQCLVENKVNLTILEVYQMMSKIGQHLELHQRPITSLNFIRHYMAGLKCDHVKMGKIIGKTTQNLFRFYKLGKKFAFFKPSIVAAAVLLATCNKVKYLQEAILSDKHINQDDFHKCMEVLDSYGTRYTVDISDQIASEVSTEEDSEEEDED